MKKLKVKILDNIDRNILEKEVNSFLSTIKKDDIDELYIQVHFPNNDAYSTRVYLCVVKYYVEE